MKFPLLLNRLSILFFVLSSLSLAGQNYLCKTEYLTVDDGLSNRFVRSIVQDKMGFMWFATKYGLNRYDGYQFKVFTKEEEGLQSNFIDKLYVDVDSNIWVGYALNNGVTKSFSGIDILNPKTFAFQSLEEKIGVQLPFLVKELYSIYPDAETGWLYLTTVKGQIYVYKGKGQFELCYSHPSTKKIHSLLLGKKYHWLSFEDGVLALNQKFELVQQVSLPVEHTRSYQIMGEAAENAVWFYLEIDEANFKKWYWKLDTVCIEKEAFDFFKEPKFVGQKALFYQQPQSKHYIYYNHEFVQLLDENKNLFFEYHPALRFIRTFYIDNQENLWCAVPGEALIKVSYQKNKFNTYFKGIPTRAITTLYKDSILLANSFSNSLVYDLKTKKNLSSYGSGLDLIESKDGKYLWLGAEERGLSKKNKNSLQEEHFYVYKKEDILKKETSFSGESMLMTWALYEDKNGRIWVGTSSGLGYLDKNADSLRVFFDYSDYPELGTAIINYFHENEQGLWIASSMGLFLLDLEKGLVQKIGTDKNASAYIPHQYILHIHEQEPTVFWLSTRGGGIIKLDLETKDYQQFTTREGLSHNIVYAILEDEQHNFWMSSDYGLMRFSPQSYIVNTYLPRDGILHEEFNRTSAYKAANGAMYFGGIKGVIGFNPKELYEENKQEIPLRIIQYQYFDGEKGLLEDRTQTLLETEQIVLDYSNRFFVLSFALLDYKSDKERHYAYKIEGLDEDWHFIDENLIRINSLAPGNYTLKIKGQGSNGEWSSVELNLPILAKQPFYLTWQFLLSLGLALLLGVVLYFKWRVFRFQKTQKELEEEVRKRTKKIEQQANELRELDLVKSKFFANISHELRTPLTLILGPVNAILEQHYGKNWDKIEGVLGLVKRNAHELQNLIEEILVLSKLETQNIDLEESELALFPFVEHLFLAFQNQADLQKIDYQLEHTISHPLFVLLDSNKFEKIVNNLLSNALKFTPSEGRIVLKMKQEAIGDQVYLLLEVKDNGKGITAEDLPYIFDRYYQSKDKNAIVQGGTGIGLALAYEFAQLLGGELTVESEVEKGSTFLLKMPLKIIKTEDKSIPAKEVYNLENEKSSILPKHQEGKATILIVEDNKDMASFIADLLSLTYTIVLAENGRIALDILKEKALSIDLILSDIMMPEMDGFELMQAVKSHALWKELPMIMLTAKAGEQDKLLALRLGVDDYLLKPFLHEELLLRIQNLLHNYKERKTWKTKAPEDVQEEESASSQDEWLQHFDAIVQKEIGNSQFGLTSLATDLNLSERQLRRKIKSKTGLSPQQYITLTKLEMARSFLETKKYETVAEVAFKIGYSNVSHFSKIYQEQYGKKPIEYLKNKP